MVGEGVRDGVGVGDAVGVGVAVSVSVPVGVGETVGDPVGPLGSKGVGDGASGVLTCFTSAVAPVTGTSFV